MTFTPSSKSRREIGFRMEPVDPTARTYVDRCFGGDLARIDAVPAAQRLMRREYAALAARTLARLPGETCGTAAEIRAAAKADPLSRVVAGKSPDALLRLIVQRHREKGMDVPDGLRRLVGWGSLLVRFHWRHVDLFGFNARSNGAYNLPTRLAGRPKSALADLLPELAPNAAPPSLPSASSPSQILFGNRLLGISWRRTAFGKSRLFLLRDGEDVLIGVTPPDSAFDPYALIGGTAEDDTCDLYVAGEDADAERAFGFKSISGRKLDEALETGELMLFALTPNSPCEGEAHPCTPAPKSLFSAPDRACA